MKRRENSEKSVVKKRKEPLQRLHVKAEIERKALRQGKNLQKYICRKEKNAVEGVFKKRWNGNEAQGEVE